MNKETIYYEDYKNYLFTPETDEEAYALMHLSLTTKAAEEFAELYEETEGLIEWPF